MVEIIKKDLWVPEGLAAQINAYDPKTQFGALIKTIANRLDDHEMAAELLSRVTSMVVIESELRISVFRGFDSEQYNGGRVVTHEMARELFSQGLWPRIPLHSPVVLEDYGVVSRRVITTAGVGFLVDAFQALTTLSNMKYHGFGSDNTAESSAQTALIAEFTTEYASNNTRPTGSQTEQSANIYKTVSTFSPDATVTVEEHGLFDQAANSGGVLWDRSLTTTKALTSGVDSLSADYRGTFTAGG